MDEQRLAEIEAACAWGELDDVVFPDEVRSLVAEVRRSRLIVEALMKRPGVPRLPSLRVPAAPTLEDVPLRTGRVTPDG